MSNSGNRQLPLFDADSSIGQADWRKGNPRAGDDLPQEYVQRCLHRPHWPSAEPARYYQATRRQGSHGTCHVLESTRRYNLLIFIFLLFKIVTDLASALGHHAGELVKKFGQDTGAKVVNLQLIEFPITVCVLDSQTVLTALKLLDVLKYFKEVRKGCHSFAYQP